MPALEYEVLASRGPAIGSVIWLHGIGQDAPTLMPLAETMDLAEGRIRNVFPRAPRLAQTLAGQTTARVWFGQSILRVDQVDLPSLYAAEAQLAELIDAEAREVTSERVALVGFSQGAALALATALRHPRRLGGLAVYAPFMPSQLPLADTISPAGADLPIWVGHGRDDMVVPIVAGIRLHLRLRRWGQDITWHTYPGGHELSAKAAEDLRAFLLAVLSDGPRHSA